MKWRQLLNANANANEIFFRDAAWSTQIRYDDRWKTLKLTHIWLLWRRSVDVSKKDVKIISRSVKIFKEMWIYSHSKYNINIIIHNNIN